LGRIFAYEEAFVGAVPLPKQLSDVTVRVNETVIPLIYVSSTEIYGELPPALPTSFSVSVATPNGRASLQASNSGTDSN
jgi:uncharacterized protein (TIGR03437 family)